MIEPPAPFWLEPLGALASVAVAGLLMGAVWLVVTWWRKRR